MTMAEAGLGRTGLTAAVNSAIDIYQQGKPITTERCVIDGVSCSERFRNDFNGAVEAGASVAQAMKVAVKNTLTTCSQINGYTGPLAEIQAGTRLVTNTAGHLIGLSFADEQGGCPGTESTGGSWKDTGDTQDKSSDNQS